MNNQPNVHQKEIECYEKIKGMQLKSINSTLIIYQVAKFYIECLATGIACHVDLSTSFSAPSSFLIPSTPSIDLPLCTLFFHKFLKFSYFLLCFLGFLHLRGSNMASQIPFGIVEHVLIKLGSSAFQEIGSMYGVPKEITKLSGKLSTLKAVLLDAEENQQQQQQNNNGVEDWVRRLKGVVYEADDLLDDYATQYIQKKGLAEQVSDFFSSENQVAFRFKMSHKLKDINKILDEIIRDVPLINLIQRGIVVHEGVENNPRETHSFVLATETVGRDENKEEVIGKLVSSKNEEKLSVVAIVGLGGMGKTTLTQLVFNDERVGGHFELKIWACIADDSGSDFDVKKWIKKIIKSVYDENAENLSLEIMAAKLHGKISQKRYLLIMDDVWNENPETWDGVRTLLMVGAKGSKIVVTTRKPKVASIMGDNAPISLEGLQQNQSWELFSKIAFIEGRENVHPKIVEIGEKIARMCKGVPLIIKTLAKILQSKREEGQWLSIRNNKNLLSLGDENKNVIGVLKLSYDNLPTHLKQCFTYCALFPKGYEIKKRSLVQLWTAQGYIQSSNDENGRLEDIGDRYFEELLSRSLLETAKNNSFTNASSYKMHDLIHDLAQSIVGTEILILRNDITNIPKDVRHLLLFERVNPMIKALKGKPIRSLVDYHGHWGEHLSTITEVLRSCKSLRVLRIVSFTKNVSTWLDKLSHLRYLDLSGNDFEEPPNVITRLKNLQTLKLNECWNLKRFPKDIRKLINLRHLEYDEKFNYLTHTPQGIGRLTLLQNLPLFVVGNEKELSRDHKIGSLIELKWLDQLRGGLCIKNLENVRNAAEVSREEILRGKKYLESLRLEWERGWARDHEETSDVDDELLMEGLQPHTELKELFISGYEGIKFPSWMMNDGLGSLLPNLIKIEIWECSMCQILPPFSQLPFLKSLKLFDMPEVEGMKEGSSATHSKFFPALQFLKFSKMLKLKGLWRMGSGAEQGPSFPHLSELEIEECPELTSFELHSSPCLSNSKIKSCPGLTSFKLHSSPRLSTLEIDECLKLMSFELHSSPSLSKLEIFDCHDLTFLELQSSPSLSQFDLSFCHNLKSLKLLSMSSLTMLNIWCCDELTSLELPSSPGLSQLEIRYCPNLTSLNEVSLSHLEKLSLSTVRQEVLIMFVSASCSLESLFIDNIDDTVFPPHELLQHLSTVHYLKCSGLATSPSWIGSLASLSVLEICNYPNLTCLELQSSSCLSSLKVSDCRSLTCLELHSYPCLSSLKIEKCPELASFKAASLPRLEKLNLGRVGAELLSRFMPVFASISLKSLYIWGINDMVTLPEDLFQHLSTLQTLHILECSRLATLPHSIGSLISLTELGVHECCELTLLPEEMRSLNNLQKLYICDCLDLLIRCRENTGEDWSKIVHIPHIYFYDDDGIRFKVCNP